MSRTGMIGKSAWTCLILAFLFLMLFGCGGGGGGGEAAPTPSQPTGNCSWVAGTWHTYETEYAEACGSGVYNLERQYVVSQDGCAISVSVDGQTFSGTVNDNIIQWQGSYPDDGGTTSASISLTVSGSDLTGSTSWTWSDGHETCAGTTDVVGINAYPTPQPGTDEASCQVVEGTWDTTETVDATNCSEGVYTQYRTYQVAQNGCIIDVTIDGLTYSGTVSGTQLSWFGSFPEDGGTTSASVSLIFTGTNLGGLSSWTWTDGGQSCSGTTTISSSRSAGTP